MTIGQVTIYALIDPRRPEEVRYVGKAQNPRTRHLQHCTDGAATAKGQWLDLLRHEGVFPQMIELETVAEENGITCESIWIRRFKSELLLNDAVAKTFTPAQYKNNGSRKRGPITGELLPWQKVERDHMIALLKTHGGKIAPAAHAMNISRPTFYERMTRFGISRTA